MDFRRAVVSGVLLGFAALGGCASRAYVAYRVPAPPPPLTAGVVGYAPAPGYVWIDGFWDLHGSRWVWVGGRWERPPRRGAIWVANRWERHGDGWRFHSGYWR